MAHGTRINGTAYGITGGKCMVNGTAYSIKKGRTLIGGTGYDITFGPETTVTVSQDPENSYRLRGIYVTVNDGSQITGYPKETVTVSPGVPASLYIYAPDKHGDYYYVYAVNDVAIETNAIFLSKTLDVTGKTVTVEFKYRRGRKIEVNVTY